MKGNYFSLIVLTTTLVAGSAQGGIVTIADEASWQSMAGAWSEVGFEDFLGPVSDQYSGVTFSPFHGGAPYSAPIFPLEGRNSMFTVVPMTAGDGGWRADLTVPARAVAFWSYDVQSAFSRVQLFDRSNSLLADVGLMASGSGHGPSSYGFNGFVSSSFDISRIEVAINGPDLPLGDAVWFDKFMLSSTSPKPVPEPHTIWLLGTAVVAFRWMRRTIAR